MNLVGEMFERYFDRILRVLGGESLLALKIQAENDEDKLLAFDGVMERKLSVLEKNYGQKSFTFRDAEGVTVLYQYILEFHKEEDVDGTPMIVLNDFPPFIKGDKQNPVLHMELRYSDVDVRDEDHEMLLLCRK